jgi:hypothetical protein
MALAHKLSMQLRAAEDRIIQLEAEVSLFRDRVTRRRRVASNDPQRNRAKAHHPKISLWYRTNVGLIEFKYGTKSVSLWLSSSLSFTLLIDMREIAQRNEIEHADIASPAAALGCSRMNEFWRD